MQDIKAQLHLDRERLVALAILLGCDYLPKGIPSVGRDLAMKFMSSIPITDSVLERCTQNIVIYSDICFAVSCRLLSLYCISYIHFEMNV